MGYWTKYFIDGSQYTGTDEDILRQKASWTRSKNEGIWKVSLEHNNHLLEITGIGIYWQSDRLRADVFDNTSMIIRRRIMRQISKEDRLVCFSSTKDSLSAAINAVQNRSSIIRLTPDLHGQWIVLNYNVLEDEHSYFMTDRVK